MKRWRHAFGAVCSIAVLAPLSLGAQQFGAGFAAGYNVFGGSDYENTDGALQFEGVVRVAFEGSFQLGVGAMMAGYDIDVVDESVKHLQVFAEPRWVFETASNITPFIAGRAAWSKGAPWVLASADCSQPIRWVESSVRCSRVFCC